jgi:ketosteroid isomerase-like protein
MKTNTETVRAMYEAFGRGDVSFILDQLADDVQWEAWADNSAQQHGVAYMKAGVGKEAVLGYFNIIGQLNLTDFRVLSILDGGEQVASEFVVETGPSAFSAGYRDEEMHLWTFNASGKVIRLRHYLDTFKHIRAAQVTAEAGA